MNYEPPTLTYLGTVDPEDPGRVLMLHATVYDGWRVRLWRRIDTEQQRFDGVLTDGQGRDRYSLAFSPSVEKGVESMAWFLSLEVGATAHEIARALLRELKSRKPEEAKHA